jgi:hypothetical protein
VYLSTGAWQVRITHRGHGHGSERSDILARPIPSRRRIGPTVDGSDRPAPGDGRKEEEKDLPKGRSRERFVPRGPKDETRAPLPELVLGSSEVKQAPEAVFVIEQ